MSLSFIARYFTQRLIFLFTIITVSGCAHFPMNAPLEVQPAARLSSVENLKNDPETVVFLTFSGGGTRAASYAYGVLETLRDTEVTISGEKRRLLDEVDIISSVSGGSFVSSYYALFGDRIFEDFEKKFLKKNIQSGLVWKAYFNGIKLAAPNFDRSDLAAEYYDKVLFKGATFGDVFDANRVHLLVNATDITSGAQFDYTEERFNMICSDLREMSISRAVASSSAVPFLLTPIVLENRAGTCGYETPSWMEEALKNPDKKSRQYRLAEAITAYLDSDKKRYIHLMDGGLADNLGIRVLLNYMTMVGGMGNAEADGGTTKRIYFITVNSQTMANPDWDKSKRNPTIAEQALNASRVTLNAYSYETVNHLKQSINIWEREVNDKRCGVGAEEKPDCKPFKIYLSEISFENTPDPEEGEHLAKLPTSFVLEPKDVDRLREAARKTLENDQSFKEFVRDLNSDN